MSVQFTIIRNPQNILMKYEVWVKGESVSTDKMGQPMERYQFCQRASSFFTLKGAEGFIRYREETSAFRGVFA